MGDSGKNIVRSGNTRTGVWAVFTMLLLVCVAVWGMERNPFKVIDPTNPRFDVTKFRFADYRTDDGFADALRKLFPEGTPKDSVDTVLRKYGMACYSDELPSKEASFLKGYRVSERWSDDGFYTDYLESRLTLRGHSRRYAVRILFDAGNGEVVEIHSDTKWLRRHHGFIDFDGPDLPWFGLGTKFHCPADEKSIGAGEG